MERSLFNSLLLPDLKVMLEENDGAALQEFCDALYPGVAAEVLEGLEPAQAWQVISHCQPDRQAYIFQFLPLPYQVALVESIDRKPLSRLIEQMSPDDRVDLLERMDPEEVENLLPLVAQAERADIRKLLSYPEYSAGSIMTTEYASLPADITVQEAINRLRLQAPSRETIYYVYVTDADRHLIGFLSLRHLIEAKPKALLSDVMERDVISVRVDDDQEHVAQEIAKYDFIAIPVVDNQNKLVGIVTHDDAADVLLEEATEDQQRLAAVEPLEDAYLQTPIRTLAWKRGVWLLILLGASFATAGVIGLFVNDDSSTVSWMMMFLPLVLASGGNTGSQSATLIIRSLALGESSRGDWTRIALRESMLGLTLGTVLGTVAFGVACAMVAVPQALAVGLTVVCVVFVGSLVGGMLPIWFQWIGVDPALMSNPLVAALVDVMGVIVYYTVAGLVVTV